MSSQLPRASVVVDGLAGALAIAGTVPLAPVLRRWYGQWGATEAEKRERLPGDELVPYPRSDVTLAVTIQAPAALVWPWLLQIGCQRAGWYSYDLLDNGGQPSAERIVPEYQHLAVGDIVKAMPRGNFGFPVAQIDPGRSLTLGGVLNTRTGQPAQPDNLALEAYFAGGQTFVLRAARPAATRLLYRSRMGWNASLLNSLIYGVLVEATAFVMARKMLLNLKRRAEALARQPAGAPYLTL